MRFVFWLLTAFLVSCTIGTESESTMGRDTGEQLGSNESIRDKAWSTSGTLLAVDTSPANRLSLQAAFSRAGNYTVQFQVEMPLDGAGIPEEGITAKATIVWSVAGNSVQRRVSVFDGASITGFGEAVRVVIEDDSINGVATAGTQYKVGITVCPGTRGTSTVPPVFTPSITPASFDIAPAGTLVVEVPDNAGIKSVYVTASRTTPIAAMGALVLQGTQGGFALKQYDPRDTDGWVPLTPGATLITLMNNTAAGNIIFSLDFGVDG